MRVFCYHVYAKIYGDNKDLELLRIIDVTEYEVSDIRSVLHEHTLHQGDFVRSNYVAGEEVIIGEQVIDVGEDVEAFQYLLTKRYLVKIRLIEAKFICKSLVKENKWIYVGGKDAE